MSKIIKEYYEKANVMPLLIDKKANMFAKHSDIATEFEYWIKNGTYAENGIREQGYTAKDLSTLSNLLSGEPSFVLLIELRENPSKALDRIKNGFKIK